MSASREFELIFDPILWALVISIGFSLIDIPKLSFFASRTKDAWSRCRYGILREAPSTHMFCIMLMNDRLDAFIKGESCDSELRILKTIRTCPLSSTLTSKVAGCLQPFVCLHSSSKQKKNVKRNGFLCKFQSHAASFYRQTAFFSAIVGLVHCSLLRIARASIRRVPITCSTRAKCFQQSIQTDKHETHRVIALMAVMRVNYVDPTSIDCVWRRPWRSKWRKKIETATW